MKTPTIAVILLAVVTSCRAPTPQQSGRSGPSVRDAAAVPRDVPTEDLAVLSARLRAGLTARGPDYVARTRHRSEDGGPRFTNRLILEASTYLLQHAHNPVQWWPWGEEAFARARALGRPVLLSVGYSTCHWCHVMEEESFEDLEIAGYINANYIAIKVDREALPNVDEAFMAYVQMTTGRGGWPMTVWLTPEGQPFFGGTYFPPRAGSRGSRMGFAEILRENHDAYVRSPGDVADRARAMVARVRDAQRPLPAGDMPTVSALRNAVAMADRRYDALHGGVLGAPKFPSSFPTRMLLRVSRAAAPMGPRALAMATHTLDAMRAGGIYDQLSGGFHRYATDETWLIPHFEKMLYDNALLAVTYLEAAQRLGVQGEGARFAQTARDTLDATLRELGSSDGGFYSGTDADSPVRPGSDRREEGLYFAWTRDELVAILGPALSPLAMGFWGVTEQGNFEGRNVLTQRQSLDAFARAVRLDPSVARTQLERARQQLLTARALRAPPLRDDKLITSWNALTITAFARASIALGDPRYGAISLRCAELFRSAMRDGYPPRLIVAGRSHGRAFAEDAIFLAAAFLDVFELTSDAHWLTLSAELMARTERDYGDPSHGGYFLTAQSQEAPLVRTRSSYDGPVPSPSSVAAGVWSRLALLREDTRASDASERTIRAFSQTIAQQPLALDAMLLAIETRFDRPLEVVIVTPDGEGVHAPSAQPLLTAMRRVWSPSSAVLVGTEARLTALGSQVPWAHSRTLRRGVATAYVCERGTCQLPTTDPRALERQLVALTQASMSTYLSDSP
ncbi:MAG: thioredoxin domain-containing protein [Deltaproteobacteria bacterium]|nr:thioredoxin domain-containing protein [Deltaproteobacteria bacterium]